MKSLELGDNQLHLIRQSLNIVLYEAIREGKYFRKADIHKLKIIRTKVDNLLKEELKE